MSASEGLAQLCQFVDPFKDFSRGAINSSSIVGRLLENVKQNRLGDGYYDQRKNCSKRKPNDDYSDQHIAKKTKQEEKESSYREDCNVSNRSSKTDGQELESDVESDDFLGFSEGVRKESERKKLSYTSVIGSIFKNHGTDLSESSSKYSESDIVVLDLCEANLSPKPTLAPLIDDELDDAASVNSKFIDELERICCLTPSSSRMSPFTDDECTSTLSVYSSSLKDHVQEYCSGKSDIPFKSKPEGPCDFPRWKYLIRGKMRQPETIDSQNATILIDSEPIESESHTVINYRTKKMLDVTEKYAQTTEKCIQTAEKWPEMPDVIEKCVQTAEKWPELPDVIEKCVQTSGNWPETPDVTEKCISTTDKLPGPMKTLLLEIKEKFSEISPCTASEEKRTESFMNLSTVKTECSPVEVGVRPSLSRRQLVFDGLKSSSEDEVGAESDDLIEEDIIEATPPIRKFRRSISLMEESVTVTTPVGGLQRVSLPTDSARCPSTTCFSPAMSSSSKSLPSPIPFSENDFKAVENLLGQMKTPSSCSSVENYDDDLDRTIVPEEFSESSAEKVVKKPDLVRIPHLVNKEERLVLLEPRVNEPLPKTESQPSPTIPTQVRPYVFSYTHLNEPEVQLVHKLARFVNGTVVSTPVYTITHLITPDESSDTPTLKYVVGIAVKAHILPVKWVRDSLDKNCLLSPEDYIVNSAALTCLLPHRKPLFDKISFHVMPDCLYPSSETIESLIKFCGGKIYVTFDDILTCEDKHKMIVCSPLTLPELELLEEGCIIAVENTWISQCIWKYQLVYLEESFLLYKPSFISSDILNLESYIN